MPEIVTEMKGGYKGVRYERLIPLLIESIKEQAGRIDKLESEIEELKNGK